MTVRAALWTTLAVGLLAVPVLAHPTATTGVSIAIGDRSIDVTITTDADALRVKLAALGKSLMQCVDLRLDGISAALQLQSRVALAAGREAIHLHADILANATQVTWSSSLVMGSYPLVFRRAGAADVTEWLQGTDTTRPYILTSAAAGASFWARAGRSVALGFTHILPNGADHILFVLGLFLLTTNARSVLAQVTAFTAAHSITLGLALYGLVSLPSRIVEPLIAISIAYVAAENLATSTQAALPARRIVLVFVFGLLHGMGFAEALTRLQLQRSELLTTLVGFNAGVELGQLTVIAAAWSLAALWPLSAARFRRFVVIPASIAIAAIGVCWTVQRVL